MLNAIADLKETAKRTEERGVEILEALARIDTKFDQYNGFNDKLTRLDEKHERDISILGAALKETQEKNVTLKTTIDGLNTRFYLLMSGIGLIVTLAFNVLADYVKGLL